MCAGLQTSDSERAAQGARLNAKGTQIVPDWLGVGGGVAGGGRREVCVCTLVRLEIV